MSSEYSTGVRAMQFSVLPRPVRREGWGEGAQGDANDPHPAPLPGQGEGNCEKLHDPATGIFSA